MTTLQRVGLGLLVGASLGVCPARGASDPRLALALAAKRRDDLPAAQRLLDALVSGGHGDSEAHWLRAWVSAANGRVTTARLEFEQFLAGHPEPARAAQAQQALTRLSSSVVTAEPSADPLFESEPPAVGARGGRATLRGTVAAVDLLTGTVDLQVSEVLAPTGARTGVTGTARLLLGRHGQFGRVAGRDGRPIPPAWLPVGTGVSCQVSADRPRTGGLDLTVAVSPRVPAPRSAPPALDPDGVSHQVVTVPMVWPVMGPCDWEDTFLAERDGGKRRHFGQDLMADKLTPLVAVFDGMVNAELAEPGGHHTLHVTGDNGWSAVYLHLNNDNPGTNDGLGGARFAFAPGLTPGCHVWAGEFLAYVGNSGNAEQTDPHLHLELWSREERGGVVSAAPSLRASQHLAAPWVLPMPDLGAPAAGERWLEGAVETVDAPRSVVVINLRSAAGQACTPPARAWLRWPEAASLTVLGDPATTLDPLRLTPGTNILAVARVQRSATGESFAVRTAVAESAGLVLSEDVAAALAGGGKP